LFGGIIGLIFGLIIIVTIGGFSAIILNYFKNIEEISENLNDLSIFASLIMKKHNINVPDVEDNGSETWICGNCSFRNEIYLSNCKNCGKSFER
jgi:ArsR family metal-binding transcriptional regulator